MRRTSSRRLEERINGQPSDAGDAPYEPAPNTAMKPPSTIPPSAPKDFTAQVMARLAAPPAPADPRIARQARARTFARIYITLIVAAGLGIALITLYAPWILVTGVADLVNGALYVFSAIAYGGRSTGGFINGSSVLYALMFAALAPLLFLVWRRVRKRSPSGL